MIKSRRIIKNHNIKNHQESQQGMKNHQEPQQGRVLGGILLLTGCCIGAGMLGLPAVTVQGGFLPTLLLFVIVWGFMAATGLFFLEVNLWFTEETSMTSMAGRTLGKGGQSIGTALFALLFFSLMVAYVGGSGELFSEFFKENLNVALPGWVGSFLLSFFFGIVLYFGTAVVDRINRVLMIGLIATYSLLVVMGGGHVDVSRLVQANWSSAIYAMPVMIVSFGYHNLIPSLSTYLKHDVQKLRFIVLVGSAIPLIIYLLWEWVILGVIPIQGEDGACQVLSRGDMVVCVLRQTAGSSWIVGLADYFSFFAIATSFLGVALSFVDFLADGLSIKKNAKGKIFLCALCLSPPFFFAILNPNIFLDSLRYAGIIAVVLFGILPPAMIWSGRYVKKLNRRPLVPGGKAAVIAVMMFSIFIVALEIYRRLA
ncbi:MAG: aromatic amino acid transport family protein [Waddliaceae bacterium]